MFNRQGAQLIFATFVARLIRVFLAHCRMFSCKICLHLIKKKMRCSSHRNILKDNAVCGEKKTERKNLGIPVIKTRGEFPGNSVCVCVMRGS